LPDGSYALEVMDIGHYFRQYRRLMAHWKSLYGEDILDFNYDSLVRALPALLGPRAALRTGTRTTRG